MLFKYVLPTESLLFASVLPDVRKMWEKKIAI